MGYEDSRGLPPEQTIRALVFDKTGVGELEYLRVLWEEVDNG